MYAALEPVAAAFGMQWSLNPEGRKVRTLLMASKSAHCLNDLLFQQRSGTLPIEIPAIVSNHQDLAGLAEFYGIPFHYIPVTADTKVQAEDELRAIIAEDDIELTVLARYMQILSNELCTELTGKAINIHHSFLPSFKGAKPYHQAHARGVKLIGATAHYVTAALDEGPSSNRKSSGWTTPVRPSSSCRWAGTWKAALWPRPSSGTPNTGCCWTETGQSSSTRVIRSMTNGDHHGRHLRLAARNTAASTPRRVLQPPGGPSSEHPLSPQRVEQRDRFIGRLKSEGRHDVLEIGTGTGLDGLKFVQAGIHYTGVDLAEEQVRQAPSRGLDVSVASARRLPSPTAHFLRSGP